MDDPHTKELDEKKKTTNANPIIFKSSMYDAAKKIQVPDMSLPDFLFSVLETKAEEYKDRIWVTDVVKGKSYKYSDVKPLCTKFASAITRMGFKKGDVLYYVTYDTALIFIVQIGVWMCGGVLRGCFQKEDKEEFHRQMEEISANFILCEPETAQSLKWAAGRLGWPIKLLSIGGKVEGATSVESMIDNDDGSAFPRDLKINPKDDIASIYNTNGSTGLPKGAVHTHYNIVAFINTREKFEKLKKPMGESLLSSMASYLVGTLFNMCWSIIYGYRCLNICKFDQKTYLKDILKYKPETLLLYPYVANWLARTLENDVQDFSFIKNIFCGGSVLDIVTCKMLATRLPQIKITQLYGMSECFLVSCTDHNQQPIHGNQDDETVIGLKIKRLNDEPYVSSGSLFPLAEVKIIDPARGCTVGLNIKGNLWIRVPYRMKGYANRTAEKGYIAKFDEDGWYDSGDIGFIDEEGQLYIFDRQSSVFKYYMHHISPAELEAVIGEHPAVLSVVVVGVPNPVTTSVARAYVVLKPNCKASEEEIKQFVAERKIFYKQLHGGVEFVDKLPESRGGKLDRQAVLRKAIADTQSKSGTNLKK